MSMQPGRPRRRRIGLAAVSVAAVAAASLSAVGVVSAGRSGDPNQIVASAELGAVDWYSTNAHIHRRALQIAQDRAQAARCERPAYVARHPQSCPPVVPQATARLATPGAAAQMELLATSDDGAWGAPAPMTMIAEHTVVLPNGKVFVFGPSAPRAENSSRAALYDPATGALERVDPPIDPSTGRPYNIWCAGQVLLANGTVLVVGGNLGYPANGLGWKGLKKVFTFNPSNRKWTVQPDMYGGRWYPTLVKLPDGRVVIYGGYDTSGNQDYTRDIEIFTPASTPDGVGSLARKTSTRNPGLYSQMALLPNGNILHAGPREGDPAILNTSTWTWQTLSRVDRRYWGSHVIMDEGAGKPYRLVRIGGADASNTAQERRTAYVDLRNPTGGQTFGPSLNTARAHLNTVVLPDGSLLTVGGGLGQGSNGSLYAGPVYQTELFSPATNSWRPVGNQVEPRTYHSTAALLPDGRVLSTGDDRNAVATSNDDRVEVYSPPYLFRGPRPAISDAPASVAYNAPFTVTTPQAAAIRRAVLIAPAAVTHSTDMNARSLVLAQSAPSGDTLTLTSPASASMAPPGDYMLFLVDDKGVPSIARWVAVGTGATPPPPVNSSPTAGFTFAPTAPTTAETVLFTDTSTDSDGTVTAWAWDLDDDGQFDDGSQRSASRTFPAAGTFTVRLSVTDDKGATGVATRAVTVTAAPSGGGTGGTVPIPAANLTVNPSFETGITGWKTFKSAISRVAVADAPNGEYAVQVAYAATDGSTSYNIDDSSDTVSSTVSGRAYTATAYVRAATASSVGKGVRVNLREKLTDNSQVKDTGGPQVTLTNAWQPVTVSATATATGNRMEVRITQSSAAAGNAFLADAITVVPG